MATLQYLGHSAFYLEGHGIKALIDPFIVGEEAEKAAAPYIGKDSKVNYIFLTHAHDDHVGVALDVAKQTGATIFAVNELAEYYAQQGFKTEGMHIGGRGHYPFGSVKMTIAFHGSSDWKDGKLVFSAMPCGFLIEADGKKVYHAGDTGLTVEMTLLEAEGVDVALLPIGGIYTMDLDDAVRAAGMIKAKTSVPMHYDTFPVIKADPQEFAKKVGPSAHIMKIGDKIEL